MFLQEIRWDDFYIPFHSTPSLFVCVCLGVEAEELSFISWALNLALRPYVLSTIPGNPNHSPERERSQPSFYRGGKWSSARWNNQHKDVQCQGEQPRQGHFKLSLPPTGQCWAFIWSQQSQCSVALWNIISQAIRTYYWTYYPIIEELLARVWDTGTGSTDKKGTRKAPCPGSGSGRRAYVWGWKDKDRNCRRSTGDSHK